MQHTSHFPHVELHIGHRGGRVLTALVAIRNIYNHNELLLKYTEMRMILSTNTMKRTKATRPINTGTKYKDDGHNVVQ